MNLQNVNFSLKKSLWFTNIEFLESNTGYLKIMRPFLFQFLLKPNINVSFQRFWNFDECSPYIKGF
jgi:hypothetical protein